MKPEDSPREGGGTGCKRVDPIEAECWTRETEGNAGAEAVMAGTAGTGRMAAVVAMGRMAALGLGVGAS